MWQLFSRLPLPVEGGVTDVCSWQASSFALVYCLGRERNFQGFHLVLPVVMNSPHGAQSQWRGPYQLPSISIPIQELGEVHRPPERMDSKLD